MTHPDQSDFLANRIRYVQNQPHLQQPPAPETSPGPRITRATRFTGPPKLTRPSSYLSTNMEREKIHQTHSSTRQRGSILTPSKSIDSRCRMSSNLDTWNPETSLGSDPSWFIRFPLVHQAPESPGQPGLPGHPSSPGPAVHQAQGPPDHQSSPFSNNRGRECKSNGMVEACHASTPTAAGCRYGKLMRELFSLIPGKWSWEKAFCNYPPGGIVAWLRHQLHGRPYHHHYPTTPLT